MFAQSIFHTYKRYRSLQTDIISALPIVILMPHSACNCRCIMCDIWKDNKNLKQLTESDLESLLTAFKKLGTQVVVMSGGEALLNRNFFKFCEILGKEKIKVTLLSTGLSIQQHVEQLLQYVSDIIVSLDGDEITHDSIRRIPGAFQKLKNGVGAIKSAMPSYRITGRTVIHKLNFRNWIPIVESAKSIGLDQISFLPADVSSHAFNREVLWAEPRQQEILLAKEELAEMKHIIDEIISRYSRDFENKFIAESPEKLQKIHLYYASFYQLNPLPYKKCNAPWVSAVIEADGTVRPCFFHQSIGNIRQDSLLDILNSGDAIRFRKTLDVDKDTICKNCVCYLNLSPRANLG